MGFKEEKYFTVGLIITMVGLYSTSLYSYIDSAHAKSDSSVVAVSYNENAASERAQKILEVVNSENGQTIFRPISSGGVIVPGSTCVIAAENVGSKNEFIKIPASCFLSAN
jgi:methylmalonyl-CoA mutase cobalamin-binding subunit